MKNAMVLISALLLAQSCLAMEKLQAPESPNAWMQGTYFELLPTDITQLLRKTLSRSPLIYECSMREALLTLVGHKGMISSAQFNKQGDKVVTGSNDGAAKIWQVENGLLLATLTGHTKGVWFARFNKQGDKIVTASVDKTAKIWLVENGSLLATLTGHTDVVRQLNLISRETR